MAEGWIKLHRSLQEHWLWKNEPFDKRSAFIDLLFLANFEDKKLAYKGEVITCKRGDVNLSIACLAKRWHWDRKTVRRFLKLLESDGMVSIDSTTHRTTVTLVNYDKYQLRGTTEGTTKSQQSGQPSPTTKELKNVKNVLYKPSFNTFEKQDYDIAAIEKSLGVN